MSGSKSLSDEMASHVKLELEQLRRQRALEHGVRKWTETQLGEDLGLSQPHINKILKDGQCGPSTLVAMSRFTHRSINSLLGHEAPVPDLVLRAEELVARLGDPEDVAVRTLVNEIRRLLRFENPPRPPEKASFVRLKAGADSKKDLSKAVARKRKG